MLGGIVRLELKLNRYNNTMHALANMIYIVTIWQPAVACFGELATGPAMGTIMELYISIATCKNVVYIAIATVIARVQLSCMTIDEHRGQPKRYMCRCMVELGKPGGECYSACYRNVKRELGDTCMVINE